MGRSSTPNPDSFLADRQEEEEEEGGEEGEGREEAGNLGKII